MIAFVLLAVGAALLVGLLLDAAADDAAILPARGEVYEAPTGQRIRVWSARDGRVLVERVAGDGGALEQIPAEDWRLVAVDPDLLIPPAREYGPRGGAR